MGCNPEVRSTRVGPSALGGRTIARCARENSRPSTTCDLETAEKDRIPGSRASNQQGTRARSHRQNVRKGYDADDDADDAAQPPPPTRTGIAAGRR
jgi:hypothetical protein